MKVHPSLVMSLSYQESALAPALLVLALAILAVSPMSASQASPRLLPDPGLFQPWRTYDVPNVVLRRWLNEDVVYIIADEERQAFLKLRTYEEYESFIEQFWRSRDPTPETRENEFKKEHYRRIAVANRLFAYQAVPGWKTDLTGIRKYKDLPKEVKDYIKFIEDYAKVNLSANLHDLWFIQRKID